jgi:hypothetical protein
MSAKSAISAISHLGERGENDNVLKINHLAVWRLHSDHPGRGLSESPQGLKPSSPPRCTARLKPCPDTKPYLFTKPRSFAKSSFAKLVFAEAALLQSQYCFGRAATLTEWEPSSALNAETPGPVPWSSIPQTVS